MTQIVLECFTHVLDDANNDSNAEEKRKTIISALMLYLHQRLQLSCLAMLFIVYHG